jgi:hypothetical protein
VNARVWVEATFQGRLGRARKDDCAHFEDEWLFVPDVPRGHIDHSHPRQGQDGFVLTGKVVGPPPWWVYESPKDDS